MQRFFDSIVHPSLRETSSLTGFQKRKGTSFRKAPPDSLVPFGYREQNDMSHFLTDRSLVSENKAECRDLNPPHPSSSYSNIERLEQPTGRKRSKRRRVEEVVRVYKLSKRWRTNSVGGVSIRC